MRIVPPGGGEVVGSSPERRVEILSDAAPLHATLSRFASGREGADLHVHREHSDLFYVLEGELTVRLGLEDEQVIVPAGSLARVPPLVVHGFRNASGADMRYLNFHAPGMDFANYMRALRDGRPYSYDQHDPPADGGRPISEAVVEIGDEFTAVDAIEVRRFDGTASVDGGRLASYFALGELEVDGERAVAGSWVQVPAGVAHTARGTFLRVLT